MEALRTPASDHDVAPIADMWELFVDGTVIPADTAMWLEGDTPVMRLFAFSSPVSGHEVAVMRDGQIIHVVEVRVVKNKPLAVTIRFT